MEIIHADNQFNDLRSINRIIKFDAEINLMDESDFELQISSDVWEIQKVEIGHIIYVPGTEFGGIVDRIRTKNKVVTVDGKTWRGYLNKNIVLPPQNEAYKEVNGKADTIIKELLNGYFGAIYTVEKSDIDIQDKYRFEEIGYAIESSLQKVGARLEITQNKDNVSLLVVNAKDWSDEIEFSEDYGVLISIDNDKSQNINHVVGLGKGELTDRLVIQAWLLEDSTITYDASHPSISQGLNLYTYKLDYPNAESEEKLKEAIEKTFKDKKGAIKTTIDFKGAQLPNVALGDIVASRDRLTGVYAKQRITQKIFKLNDIGVSELRYDVKEV